MGKTVFIFILYFAICLMIPYLITITMGGSCKGSKTTGIANTVNPTQGMESEITDVTDNIIRTVSAYYKAGDSAEFLKALAIVVRTYENTMKGDGTGKAPAAFVPNEFTYSEMMSEWGDYYPAYYEAVSEAVLATDGISMNVREGRMLPYFCELSAGYTRAIPDSCLIMTGCEQDLQSSDYLSIVTYSKSDVSAKIQSKYSDIKFKGEISESIQVISRDEAGYVSEIMVGNLTLSGDELANILDLKSSNFMITSGDDNMIFTVKGIGCGYGMSLHTARQKANAGASYEEILYYFYKNIELKEKTSE